MTIALRDEPVAIEPPEKTHHVVIVGGGPIGVRTAQELVERGYDVVIVNAERWRPYNRVKLTPLLAGEVQLGQIYLSEAFKGSGSIRRIDGASVTDIDRDARRVQLSDGQHLSYDKLVLALGSRAFIPPIPGSGLDGVCAFRNFDDAERLLARSFSARRVAVVGGGLLGLEAARGMRQRGAEVTVIEHESRLMPRQLDEAAGEVLRRRIEAIGVSVRTGARVERIEGESRVRGLSLAGGGTIEVDTVIICTGVRANTQLAVASGLKFNRGILVDERMRTSDPAIYAVGECCEHDGHVYGLVGPGFQQASAAVADIAGENSGYTGSIPATKLKVLGAEVFSMGDFESIEQQPAVKSHVYRDDASGTYRRIFVDRGRLVAAIGVGDWPEASRLQQAVARAQNVNVLNIRRFKREGHLWQAQEDHVASWPSQAIVCNCTGTTKGAIANAITLGASTLDDIRASTTANTVCGSCAPHVLQLLGATEAKAEPLRGWRFILGISGIALIGALVVLLAPPIPTTDTFRIHDVMTSMWYDSVWKQWSGYTLLAISLIAALIGLRKRIGYLSRLGSYAAWRFVHIAIGVAAILALVWHSGFRLGTNLNLVLMASFIVVLVAGAVTGLASGGEHALRDRDIIASKQNPRSLPLWAHIVFLWPLPVLVAIHILSVYLY